MVSDDTFATECPLDRSYMTGGRRAKVGIS